MLIWIRAWCYPVVQIQDWAATSGLDPKQTYVWICSLCVNQHKLPSNPAATFEQRIVSIGTLLPLLCPWNDPVYVKRLWCLYELWLASRSTNCTVEVLFPENEVCTGDAFSMCVLVHVHMSRQIRSILKCNDAYMVGIEVCGCRHPVVYSFVNGGEFRGVFVSEAPNLSIFNSLLKSEAIFTPCYGSHSKGIYCVGQTVHESKLTARDCE